MTNSIAYSYDVDKITRIIEGEVCQRQKGTGFLNSKNKCTTTEGFVKNFYETKGYQVMRAEVNFWQAMFALAFYEEIYAVNTDKINDIPTDLFANEYFYNARKELIDKKYEFLKTADLPKFINSQMEQHKNSKSRLIYNKDFDNIAYFRTKIVQDFLKKVDNNAFAITTYKIAQNPNQNRAGTPDFIIWNNSEMEFIEVKRLREKLKEGQIAWLEFLNNNDIPSYVVRVDGKN